MYGGSFILQKDVKRELELTCYAEFCQFCAIGHLLKVFISTLVCQAVSIEGLLKEIPVHCYSPKSRHVNG